MALVAYTLNAKFFESYPKGKQMSYVILKNKILLPLLVLPLLNACELYKEAKQALYGQETLETTDSVETLPSENYSPFVNALIANDLASIQRFVKGGAGLDELLTYNGENSRPLIVAAENGALDIVKFLVQKGADISAFDENGNPALMKAAMFGHLEVVQFLVVNGADPNQGNLVKTTPLWWAVFSDELEIVQFLLANGGDANAKTLEGKTILESALMDDSPHAAEIKALLKAQEALSPKPS